MLSVCHCGRAKGPSCIHAWPDFVLLAYIHKALRPPSYKSVSRPCDLKSPYFWEMEKRTL